MNEKKIKELELENAKLCMEILNLRTQLAAAQAPQIQSIIDRVTNELTAMADPKDVVGQALGIDPSQISIGGVVEDMPAKNKP